MPIVTGPQEFTEERLFVDLRSIVGHELYLKCEGFNFAGSVKLKAAASMVEAAERAGEIGPGSTLVESSSGNLGVALSIIAANKGYRFICVTDIRCNAATIQLMEAMGTDVRVIREAGPEGYLGARQAYVRAVLAADPRAHCLNQYSNPNSWKAHFRTTAPAIAEEFPQLDVLFVGAGTTGTLMGCARWFRQYRPDVHIVAVDAVGSVTFGQPSGRRLIPGLGTSVVPEIFDRSYIDDVVFVEEADAVAMCHRIARKGFLFGGSTGTVVSGAKAWLDQNSAGHLTSVTLAPDLGERYLETLYRTEWVRDNFGEDVLVEPADESLVA
ncbi:2,3-diaminopropionate biosynthesis protein SbnA [Pseudonocardia halophobica]|uniref:2,3-diaminopropionate biosynthesis protein SbnA n=1 Tax=Pseudonocardia halophobica TaxID=29401 RepID=UPI00055A22ED|nr:2,3-diaminopropionate biosynthesis protein SbnA [Pseudonocardia halophobica]